RKLGFGNWLDKVTGAKGRARRNLIREIADNPSISRQRAERIAQRIGEELPSSERRWESAKTTRLNHAHWARVTGQPINAELSAWANNIRHRSEYEVANNSLVEGMIQ